MGEELNEELESASKADWGKAKFDYYYTDYIDQDYPSELNSKQKKLAAIEQEEALRIQKKLLSTIDDADISNVVFDDEDGENLIESIENLNRYIEKNDANQNQSLKNKKVTFINESSQEIDFDQDGEDSQLSDIHVEERRRRPINVAIKKNRGLTPYKNKKYRNPRVKHKHKFNKVMIKRRRNVKEYIAEYNRYSGEATGIKMSTVKSIKLS